MSSTTAIGLAQTLTTSATQSLLTDFITAGLRRDAVNTAKHSFSNMLEKDAKMVKSFSKSHTVQSKNTNSFGKQFLQNAFDMTTTALVIDAASKFINTTA